MPRLLEIRTYRLKKEQAEFYGSDDWRIGPRNELVSRIDTYTNTLIWASESAMGSLRELNRTA